MRVSEDIILDAVESNSGATATQVSESISIKHIYGFSVWATWSGTTISGSIKLEASLDEENWEDITDSEVTISSATTNLWNVSNAMYPYFRVSVTADDTNTITTTAKFYGKGS